MSFAEQVSQFLVFAEFPFRERGKDVPHPGDMRGVRDREGYVREFGRVADIRTKQHFDIAVQALVLLPRFLLQASEQGFFQAEQATQKRLTQEYGECLQEVDRKLK